MATKQLRNIALFATAKDYASGDKGELLLVEARNHHLLT
jgi:hypothetical protein